MGNFRKRLLVVILCLVSALCLFGGIFSLTNSNKVSTAYADGEGYTLNEEGGRSTFSLYSDCSIDIQSVRNKSCYDLWIYLNGYTLTLSGSIDSVSHINIMDGTIIYNDSGVMLGNSGSVIISNVTFKANCKCLFALYYNDYFLL